MAEHVISPEVFESLKRYVGLGPEDEQRLRAVHSKVRERFPAIVQDFYDRIQLNAHTRSMVKDAEQIDRLKKTLTQWLDEVFLGPHDRGYYEKRVRIGVTHVRIGLSQGYVYAAMCHIRGHLSRAIYEVSPDRPADAVSALEKILDLDLALIAGSYHEERKLADLKAELDFIDAVLQTAGALVVVLDRDGRIERFNRACEQATGYGASEVAGKRFEFLLTPEERPGVTKVFEDLRAGLFPNTHENDWVSREGLRRRIAWANTALLGPDGRVEHVIATGIDITDRKQLERTLIERESLARLGEMAAVVAHEVKNPLAAISGAVQVLATRFAPKSPEAEAIRQVQVRVMRLNEVVQDLLSYAKPRRPVLASVDLGALVRETVAELAKDPVAGHVAYEVERSDVRVSADQGLLHQVFVNILLNAAQAMNGAGKVTVHIRPTDGQVITSFADTGPGIPPEIRAKVFDPFFTTRVDGSGLGLAVARRLVRLHDGDIEIECPPQGGTVVRVRLPASRA